MAMMSAMGQAPMPPSLRSKQLDLIKSMLGQSSKDTYDDIGLPTEPHWKILVYDRYGQDIITPLMSVPELRELGVTLYLQLNSKREHIPETTVVYFVMPTKENVDLICKDIEEELYDKVQLNFLSCVPSDLLEKLAAAAINSQTSTTVERVYDMYSNFICLENDLFVTRLRDPESISFEAFHSPRSDAEMESSIEQIVSSLFCVLVSIGTVPIIRCSRGHAAEAIAKQLDRKLRDHLKLPRNSLFKEGMSITGSFQRPLLALVDRHIDLSCIMHHSATYQALAHDLLDYNLNRVSYTVEEKKGDKTTTKTENFDLSSKDKFWVQNRGKILPEAQESYGIMHNEVKVLEDRVRKITSDKVGGDNTKVDMSEVKEAVETLPKILEQKRRLAGHMKVMQAILAKAEASACGDFFRLEDAIMTDSEIDEGNKNDVLVDIMDTKGSNEDKLRLYVIALLSLCIKPETLTKCEGILKSKGCDMSVVSAAKDIVKLREGQKFYGSSTSEKKSDSGSSIMRGFGQWGGMGNKLLQEFLTSHNSLSTTTQIVQSLVNIDSSCQLSKDYLYLDPKQLRPGPPTASVPKGRAPFDECIVFMVGGGNFCEYQNLADWAQGKNKSITYGTSGLVSPQQFLEQLKQLGGGDEKK